jgi:small subunit ribosomal protein S35
MATALQGFRFTARGCLCQPRAPKHATKSIGRRRPFSTTALRCQEKGEQKDKEEKDLDPALRVALNKTKKAPDAQYGRFLEAEVSNTDQRLRNFQQRQTASLQNRIKTPVFPWQNVLERPTKTFLNTNEQDPIDGFPDFDESEDADLTVLGHGELERHREMRHYARLAAWEMPMLSSKCLNAASSTNLPTGH